MTGDYCDLSTECTSNLCSKEHKCDKKNIDTETDKAIIDWVIRAIAGFIIVIALILYCRSKQRSTIFLKNDDGTASPGGSKKESTSSRGGIKELNPLKLKLAID